MNYHDIKWNDTLNGPGFRTTVFVSGCLHRCNGCHNPETWDPNGGKKLTSDNTHDIIGSLYSDNIDGITFTGGDPLYPGNRLGITNICKFIHDKFPKKTIWVYTGYDYESICNLEIMKYIDTLVDGKFEKDKYDNKLIFRGSSNQRIIDVQKSIKENKVVMYSDDNLFFRN